MTKQEKDEIIKALKCLGKYDDSFIPPDKDYRKEAAVPGDKNIIVEAGAGTGKTKLLASRICHLILSKGFKIDEIVAITFTEKAAAEIKQSVLNILRVILKVLSFNQEPEELKGSKSYLENIFGKTAEELLALTEQNFELIERAQICTIHSFAFQILKLYPLQAGLAPHTEIDTGFIADNIFNKNWVVFLEEELALDGPNKNLWEKLLENFTLEQLKNFANFLREPFFESCSFESSPKEIKDYLTNQITVAKALLATHLPKTKRKVAANEALEEAIKRLSALLMDISSLSREELLKLPVQEEIGKPKYFSATWSEEEKSFAINFIDLTNTFTPAKIDLLNQTYQLFSSLAKDVKEQMVKQNIISYNQSIYRARDLVRDNIDVRKELKKRYKSLMVDEFQDTDMAQGQLMLFLAEEENSFAKDWENIILEPGKLFVVGDPKQSIYRFRGANISAYEKFLKLMQSQQAKTCLLTTNFRSQGKIIDFVNKWGEKAIKESPLIQPKYIKLEKGEKPDSHKVEFLKIICPDGVPIEDTRKNEANIIASWIKENVGKAKLAGGQTLAYKDITILYPASTGLSFYTDALIRYNIPYNLEASGNFYEAQEIIDIINILKVIYDPQDKLALLGVLRSPLCAMKDEEILDLWQQKALNIYARDFQASSDVKKVYSFLKDFNIKAGHLTLKELLNELFYKTDFLILETLSLGSEQPLANLNKFLKIAFTQASRGATLGQFLLYIQAGDNEKESQSSLVEESFDVVNVMTIHKSKGLSAKVIILANTSYNPPTKPENKFVDDLEGKIGISLGSLKNVNYFILKEKEALHRKAEDERLLYVALTRAEEKLLICTSTYSKDGKIEKSLKENGCYPFEDNLENDLFTTLAFEYKDPQSFILRKENILQVKETDDWSGFITSWQKRKEEFRNYKREEILAPSHLKEDKTKLQAALDRGSLIHKALNNYFQTGSFDSPLAIKQLGLKEADFLEPCREILDIFEQGSVLEELKTMQFLGSEIPFSMYENGTLVNGIIDALFRKTDGKLFIVDFKTDKIDSKDLKEYSLKYEQQLMLYKKAVQKLFKNQEVVCALAYLSIDRLFEI